MHALHRPLLFEACLQQVVFAFEGPLGLHQACPGVLGLPSGRLLWRERLQELGSQFARVGGGQAVKVACCDTRHPDRVQRLDQLGRKLVLFVAVTQPTTLTIIAHGICGNVCVGASFVASSSHPSVQLGAITDVGDGSYVMNACGHLLGDHEVCVTLDGQHVVVIIQR